MSHAQNGLLFDDTGALLVTTSAADVPLAEGEYRQNGFVFAEDGSLSVIAYVADDVATYYRQNGFLFDANGRLVTTEAT